MNENDKINIAINEIRYFHFQVLSVRNTVEPLGRFKNQFARLKIGRYWARKCIVQCKFIYFITFSLVNQSHSTDLF